MRPASVSEQEIISAGIRLQEQGRAVNGFALRTHLGGGNAKRLIRIWNDRDTDIEAQAAERTGGVISLGASSAPARAFGAASLTHGADTGAIEHAELHQQLQALQAQLELAKNENSLLTSQVQQSRLVAEAVTDELNRSKLRCAQLESKEKQQDQRIAELHARIDEQRGELNRGSQARLALQKALDALLDTAPTK